MNSRYSREWTLPLSGSSAFGLLADVEKVLRLGPQWNVKELRLNGSMEADAAFELDVEYDRSEQAVSFAGKVEELIPGRNLRLALSAPEQQLDFSLRIAEQTDGSLVSFSISTTPDPSPEDMQEFDLWARSILNYVTICNSKSPLSWAWKWFLDCCWLKMSQSGKRVVLFIVVGEGLSLLFLVAILLWWKYLAPP